MNEDFIEMAHSKGNSQPSCEMESGASFHQMAGAHWMPALALVSYNKALRAQAWGTIAELRASVDELRAARERTAADRLKREAERSRLLQPSLQ